MEQGKSNVGTVVLAIVITAVVVGSGVYYFQQNTAKIDQPTVKKTDVTTPKVATTPAPKKSLVEYYKTRDQFLNGGMMKNPEILGFKEVAKVKIVCPENADGPCGGDLFILSKDALHSGSQEFYLAQAGGAGYSYYGPFSDDLQRIVNESKTIDSLKESY